jgi:predicted nucleic acid-binding protein
MIGLDTGFFLELLNGNSEVVRLWESCMDDQVDFAVSALSLFEVERLGLKGKLKNVEAVLNAINDVTTVVWLDQEILSKAARLSRGLGIPDVDSLILASLVSVDCSEIYTTDSHFEAYHNKVTVRNLRQGNRTY